MHPRLFQFGHLVIPTYGVLAAAGLVGAMVLAEWCAPRAGVAARQVGHVVLAMVVGTLVLSRLALAVQSPGAVRSFPLLVLLMPTVTRFGALFAAVSGAGAVVWQRMPWLRVMDCLAPAALVLAAFLHAGDFFAGTDLGSGTALAIGDLVRGDEGHHPVALYAAVLALVSAGVVVGVLLRQRRAGAAFGVGLSLFAVGRFVADEFRPGYVLPEWRVPGFLRVDQLLWIGLTVAGMLFLLERKKRDA